MPEYYNTAFLLSPAGDILAWYDKQRLLPFAEYFPIPYLDFLRRRFARVREFTPGVSKALLPTPAGLAGVVICNEAVFPDLPAERVRAGATYLVNPANDTWVNDPRFSAELFDMVSLRAVEQRRYLVRASTSGFSAIVDPWGRTTAVARPFTRGWVVGSIDGADGITVYGRVGDLFAFAAAVAALLAQIVLPARRRHADGGVRTCT
jgi:apolipoprotein N-acyltransferase